MIGPIHIIPLINKVFDKSYCSINPNLKALADCKWNPLNRTLFEQNKVIDDSVAPVIKIQLPRQIPTIPHQE
jgi:hypothetical protein